MASRNPDLIVLHAAAPPDQIALDLQLDCFDDQQPADGETAGRPRSLRLRA